VTTDFDAAWAKADEVSGWLTRDQGRALWEAALRVPSGGRILEIGSHQGRSTIVLASAAGQSDVEVVAVDPFIAGGMFGGAATRDRFTANIDAAHVSKVVRLVTEKSTDLRPRWTEPLDMLFIDGKHDYWTVRDDLRWTDHVASGASVLIHDAFSSIGVTLGLLVHVLPEQRLRYVSRVGSLAQFERSRASGRDRLRMLAQLPWFVRNVAIKIALRLARLVGHRSTPDPY
jgi:predicted O-methyltransferase YrrM